MYIGVVNIAFQKWSPHTFSEVCFYHLKAHHEMFPSQWAKLKVILFKDCIILQGWEYTIILLSPSPF